MHTTINKVRKVNRVKNFLKSINNFKVFKILEIVKLTFEPITENELVSFRLDTAPGCA